MVRWGVLGAGSVAQRRVIPAMVASPDCRLQALMVRDPDRARQLALQFGPARGCARVQELLEDPEVEAVYVSSPVDLHCEHVLAAAQHGKHVLCEKSMALSADQCGRMVAACQQAGVHLEVCFVLRGWAVEETAVTLVEFRSGAHGTLTVSCAVPHAGNVLEVYGTEASLLLGQSLRIVGAGGEETEPVGSPDYYAGLLTHFCRCVTHGGEPLASGLDGLRNTEAVLAAYRSAQEQRIVEIA